MSQERRLTRAKAPPVKRDRWFWGQEWRPVRLFFHTGPAIRSDFSGSNQHRFNFLDLQKRSRFRAVLALNGTSSVWTPRSTRLGIGRATLTLRDKSGISPRQVWIFCVCATGRNSRNNHFVPVAGRYRSRVKTLDNRTHLGLLPCEHHGLPTFWLAVFIKACNKTYFKTGELRLTTCVYALFLILHFFLFLFPAGINSEVSVD